LQGLAHKGQWPRPVMTEGLAEQLLLVPEGRVEARPVDAHGPGQFRQRRPLIATQPEDVECPLQGLFRVELSWATRGHGDSLVTAYCVDSPALDRPATLLLYRTVQKSQVRQ